MEERLSYITCIANSLETHLRASITSSTNYDGRPKLGICLCKIFNVTSSNTTNHCKRKFQFCTQSEIIRLSAIVSSDGSCVYGILYSVTTLHIFK